MGIKSVETTVRRDNFKTNLAVANNEVQDTINKLQRLKRDIEKCSFQDLKLNDNVEQTVTLSLACLAELTRNKHRFDWWHEQRASIVKRLEYFLEFRQAEIRAAVRNEALKSARAVKELREKCSTKKVALERAVMRREVALASQKTEVSENKRAQDLANITQGRLSDEQEEGKRVAETLRQTQLQHRNSTALHRAADMRWNEACKHANDEQKRAAEAKHSAITMVNRAAELLAEEQAVEAPPDYTDDLMEKIHNAMDRRKDLQEKVARSRALKEKARLQSLQLQHTVDKLERELSVLNSIYTVEMESLNELKERLSTEDAAKDAIRAEAQQAMTVANNKHSQAQDKHFTMSAALTKAEQAVHACDREKATKQAQMERIAKQHKQAIADHEFAERRLLALDQALNETSAKQKSEDRAMRQRIEELQNQLKVEEHHIEVVTDALNEARVIQERLAAEKEKKLGDLTRCVEGLDVTLNSLQANEAELRRQEQEALAIEATWQDKLDTLLVIDKQQSALEAESIAQAKEQRAAAVAELKMWTEKVESAPSRRQALQRQLADHVTLTSQLKEKCQAAQTELDQTEHRAEHADEEVKRLLEDTKALTAQADELDNEMKTMTLEHKHAVTVAKETIQSCKASIAKECIENPKKIAIFEELQNERLNVRRDLEEKLTQQEHAEILLSSEGEIKAAEERYAHSVKVFQTAHKLRLKHQESTRKLNAVANALDPSLSACGRGLMQAIKLVDQPQRQTTTPSQDVKDSVEQ
eukprot:TRINITY_DN6965_c0_g1_i1.p1 TRINITY_DN6965_c0_g1~~TRINITY_DN6965_c0_g1_i1.p1  ORF type:complete len:760 (+),score=242.04 TRINITY_DN6965_c0_g1_i1:89-2368(+)